jgi:hypothetical protein
MLAGYVLRSLEGLERGVVGKCCSNVLRSLRAYGVGPKTVRTCVCEKNDTAHVCRSRMRNPMRTTESEVIYTHAYVHTDIPNTNKLECLARTPTFTPVHNAIAYTMHKRAPLRTHSSSLCTALT